MNITPSSNKDEIVSNAIEFTDIQAQQVTNLQEKLNSAFWVIGVTAIYALLK